MDKRITQLLRLWLVVAFTSMAMVTMGQSPVPFTPGNIVVMRVGDGTGGTSPNGEAQATFLDEYTTTGTLVQSIALPRTGGAGDTTYRLTWGNDYFSGNISLSADGQYIIVPGADAPIGTLPFTAAGVIGRVKYDGTINTTTRLTDNAMIFGATSTDGTKFWFAGNNFGYTTIGSSSSTPMTVGSTSFQHGLDISIVAGQLYTSVLQGHPSLGLIGTGLPTTSPQPLTPLPGDPKTGKVTSQYVFLDLDAGVPGPDVLYAASDSFENGGIQKWSLVGGSWVFNGRVGLGGPSVRYSGVTAKVTGTTVQVFGVRRGSNELNIGGDLFTITDASGYNGAFSGTITLLANIAARFGAIDVAWFRGLCLVPQAPATPGVTAKIFLQGAYNSGLGRHKDITSGWAGILNTNALNQPFNTTAFGNYNGGESVASGFFKSTGATTDILDWVLVELHDASTPATIVARKAAFVREDGQVVGLDGSSAVSFTGVANGNYYLVIRHRNHLGVRSSSTVAVSAGTTASYDFTTVQSKAFQDGTITANPAMKDLGGGVFGLWGGNANGNTNVRFTGLNNDAAALLAVLGGNQAQVLNSAYNLADLNFDGVIRYTGLNNDAAALLSILAGNQANVYSQHQ